jgi:hypothetical protein
MKFPERALLLLLSLCLIPFASQAADKKQLAAALAEVNVNLKTPAGKQYDHQAGADFSKGFVPAVRQCKEASPASSWIPFDMLIQLDSKGKAVEALIYPENEISVCSRAAVLAGSFSAPPHDKYWINVRMEIKH